jgi:hypothetical protein
MSSLRVIGHIGSDVERLRNALALAFADQGVAVAGEPVSPDGLDRALADPSPLVLAYVTPGSVVSALVASGVAPAGAALDSALAAWCESGEAMLAAAARHPERCCLVNAEGALADVPRLVDEVAGWMHLASPPVADAPRGSEAYASLASLLADALLGAEHAAVRLLLELDSSAHLPSESMRPPADRAAASWQQFWHLRGELAEMREARAVGAALEARAAAAESSRDQLTEALRRAETDVATLRAELESRTHQTKRLQDECERLLLQTHEAQLEVQRRVREAEEREAARHAEAVSLSSQLRDTTHAADARASELQRCESELQRVGESLSRAQARVTSLEDELGRRDAERAESRRTREERDTVRLQLLELRAEFERVREARDRFGGRLDVLEEDHRRLRQFWRDQQPATLHVDMRRGIAGTDWHDAEADGRWTGPGPRSTVTLPALRPGRYRMQITFVGAMSAQIAAGIELAIDGERLATTFDRVKHPRVGSAEFEVRGSEAATSELVLSVPRTVSPAERGSPDQRRLGVRVAAIDLAFLS